MKVCVKWVVPSRTRLATALAVGLAAAILGGGVCATQAQAAIPSMTRAEIIARAETGIGATYSWGRESWTPNQGGGSGPDCSGFTLKCWEVPRTLLYQEEDGENTTISPRYTSYEFFNCLGPWYPPRRPIRNSARATCSSRMTVPRAMW